MKIYFATNPKDKNQRDTLNKIGAKNRLMSYPYISNMKEDAIKRALEAGIFDQDDEKAESKDE